MKLVNKVINFLDTNKNDRERRHNHQKSAEIQDKFDEMAKAFDWTVDKDKQYRYRRDTISAKTKMRDILNSFKQARDELHKEYDWKYYNMTTPWNNTTNSSAESPLEIIPITLAPAPARQHTCTKEVAISSTIFGALILCIVCLSKTIIYFREKNLKNSE